MELAEGVEGLCHFSEMPGYVGAAQSRSRRSYVGQEGDFKIIKMNEAEKKIGLSLRAVAEDEEKARLGDYQRQAAAATTTIEEAMSLKDRRVRIACKILIIKRYCDFKSVNRPSGGECDDQGRSD